MPCQAEPKSPVPGAITGGAAGLTMGASLVATGAAVTGANVIGGVVNREIQGKETNAGDVAFDAVVGAAGSVVNRATNNLSRHAKGVLGETISKVKYGARGYKRVGQARIPTGGRTPTGRVQRAFYDNEFEHVITGRRITVESKFNTSPLSGNQRAARPNITTPGGLIVDRTTSEQLGNATKTVVAGASGQIQKD